MILLAAFFHPNLEVRPVLKTLLALAILTPTPFSTPMPVQGSKGAPPSCVTLPKKSTTIGSHFKEIKAMVDANESYRTNLRVLDAETPQQTVRVETFHLMLTEVTNEQYAAFVKATGHKPVYEWGEEALQAAALAFMEANNTKREKAKAEGKPIPPRDKFDNPKKEKWWEENWQAAEWAVPKGSELRPVTYVSYADAKAYAAWAGLRLPTEHEFQRAARAGGKSLYPWGDEWVDGKYAATAEIKRLKQTMPVASYPEGVSKDGIFDLAGNVWEWTDSRYAPLKGFKKNKYTFGKGSNKDIIEPEPDWNDNQRVAVGGCYMGSKIVARATTRRATDRTQMTNAFGFRCAASDQQGLDIAKAIYENEVKSSEARPGHVKYNPTVSAAIDRWTSNHSSTPKAPEGYKVITGYDYFVFTPAEEVPHTSSVQLGKATQIDPEHLGYFTTNQEMTVPALSAGTYLLAYRASGKVKTEEPEEGEEKADEEPDEPVEAINDPRLEGVDLKADTFIFYDAATGTVAATMEASNLKLDKIRGPSTLTWEEEKIWTGTGADKVQDIQKWLLLDGSIQGPIKNRGIRFQLKMQPNKAAGTLDWR
ncbi:MAG: sulfatase modifying factor 1 [Planctomycetota bacterium]